MFGTSAANLQADAASFHYVRIKLVLPQAAQLEFFFFTS